MATDLAIPLMAEGGWPALTLRNVARAANVTPQAIAAWSPSVTAMRTAIADRYGRRWIGMRGSEARYRMYGARWDAEKRGTQVGLEQVGMVLLPQTWREKLFDGVWLSVAEAGRWDETISKGVAAVQEAERELVVDLVTDVAIGPGGSDPEQAERDADRVLALVRGLRVALTVRSDAMSDAMSDERAAEVLRTSLSGGA
jgi:AcrR family transcriptional regulator